MLTLVMAWAAWAPASAVEVDSERVLDLAEMPLEALMEVEVTTVVRRPQRVADTAAAVHVITPEDIRRAGLSSIPEALRLVPGLHVARIDAHNWAIAARGFNGRTSNKLLVQVDGRTVYSPLFAGVFWDMQDLPIEDLARIEVILGPGGTLWGANAVNGIINIITRPASETQGGAVEAGIGSLETADVMARHGGALGDNGHFRVYARHREHDEFETAAGAGAGDDWHVRRAGVRADWALSSRDSLTVLGDAQTGRLGQTALLTALAPAGVSPTHETLEMTGGDLLGRWERSREDGSRITVQAYWDHTRRDEAIADHRVDLFDVDFERHLASRGRHQLSWGLGYRLTVADVENSFTVAVTDTGRDDDVFSAFLHDEIRLRDDLHLSLGTKYEHNDFTGDELQPGARLLWNVTEQRSLWAAATRAVRTPTPIDTTLRFNQGALPGTPPTLLQVQGDSDFGSEKVVAYEVGFRGQLAPTVSLDMALFYNDYDELLGTTLGSPRLEAVPPPPHVVVPALIGNTLEGEAWGLQVTATWRPSERYQLTAGYALLNVDLEAKPGTGNVTGLSTTQESSPEQQLQLHSRLDLSRDLAFDVSMYWVDELKAFDNPSYTRVDLRLGWAPRPDLEASLGVRNLFDERHAEFASTAETLAPSEVPRGVYGRLVWRW